MTGAREEILGRIRGALADVGSEEDAAWSWSAAGQDARYRRESGTSGDRGVRFAERVEDYGARVTRAAGDDASIRRAVHDACTRQQAHRLLLADASLMRWAPAGLAHLVDGDPEPLTVAEITAADGVLSGCASAIAETGSIVLDGGPGQGRRLVSLLPDLHICVIAADQVCGGVPEAIRQLQASVAGHRRPVTLISGPSATSDIELVRVQGVHGPRRLEVILTH